MMGKSEAAGRVMDSSQSQPSDAPKSAVTEALPSDPGGMAAFFERVATRYPNILAALHRSEREET